MKKTFAIILAMCMAAVGANAQWTVESAKTANPYVKLLQVLETDNSVLVYASYTRDNDDTVMLTIDRTAHVKANGLKYKLLSSVNLPIEDEGDYRCALLRSGHNEVNFVLEFEKFPVEGGFSIIENTKNEPNYFNFYDIALSPIEPDKVIDTQRFLDSGVPVINGKNSKGGTNYLYYIRNGVCITCNAVKEGGDWFSGDDEIFYLDIVNNSDHGVKFDFDKVSVIGRKNKKNGEKEEKVWTKYTPESYEQYLRQLDYDEARYKTSSVLDDVSRQLDRERYSSAVNSWERIGWTALKALTDQKIENRIEEYMKAHPKEHPSALKTESIMPGESLHGYIAAKRKKADDVKLTIPVDGYDFNFYFNLK